MPNICWFQLLKFISSYCTVADSSCCTSCMRCGVWHCIAFSPLEGHPEGTLSWFIHHRGIQEGTFVAFFRTWGNQGGTNCWSPPVSFSLYPFKFSMIGLGTIGRTRQAFWRRPLGLRKTVLGYYHTFQSLQCLFLQCYICRKNVLLGLL